MHFNNPIDMLREEIKNIKNIVEMGELNAELRRELEKLLEKLQETLRMEVDERIPKVKADAVEERDEE
jgi:regulator of replication initiation timing